MSFDSSSILIPGWTGPFREDFCSRGYRARSPMHVAICAREKPNHSGRRKNYEHHPRVVFAPRIFSMHVTDLAPAIAPDAEPEEVGIRPGEKLHKEMISPEDSRRTILHSDRYVVGPTLAEWAYQVIVGEPVPEGFASASDTNDLWLSAQDLRQMIVELGQ